MHIENVRGWLAQSPGEAHIDEVVCKSRIPVSAIGRRAVFLVQITLGPVAFQGDGHIDIQRKSAPAIVDSGLR